jgi:small multidrug resistance family-3 protein
LTPARAIRPPPHVREAGLKYVLALGIYLAAGFAEIAGCFAFWSWLKLGRSPLWLVPGAASLMLFAWLLTRIDSDTAGRAYAAYGGVYITASLLWMRLVEGRSADRWELLGALICLGGAGVILFAPRSA